MIDGTCSHCRLPGTVWRYRLADVGLRFLDVDCHNRLVALGMNVEPVTVADPRDGTDRRSEDRGSRRASDIRSGLRWLVGRAA